MSIVNECLVVNIHTGFWTGFRLDKEVSAQVTERANADDDTARVNKRLIPKDAFKDVQRAISALRGHFYHNTLPWKDNGDRLLTRQKYLSFIQTHEKLVGEFNAAVEDFLTHKYPRAVEQAGFRMGSMFKPEDYPSVDVLRRRFYVTLDMDPVTEANDFRVRISVEADQRIRDDVEKALQERMTRALGDIWQRLNTTLGHFQQRMASDGIFRDTTVRNLEELVESIPALNIFNDPNLDKIAKQIEDRIIGYEPKELRTDPGVRNLAAQQAQEIMDSMSGFMKAFGAE